MSPPFYFGNVRINYYIIIEECSKIPLNFLSLNNG
jgi:hypothetical protein